MEGQQKYDVFISYSRKDYVDDLKNVIPGNAVSIIKKALTEVGMREVSIFEGKNFSNVNYGWGGKTPGYWATGDYRVQIWYDNRMLAEKTFKVY